MKLNNVVIYYPSFESGGVERIIKNLIEYITSKKINVFLITSNKKNLQILKKKKNFNIILIKNNYFSFLPNRFSSSINSIKYLYSVLKKMNNTDTIVHSMQSNFISIIISKILNYKVVIRNSEDAIESIRYSENKFFSFLIFFLRFIFYNFADFIVTNSKGSAKSLKIFLINKKKIKHIYNPYVTDHMVKNSKKKIKKKKIIMAAGRLTIQKNFSYLIDAFKKSELIKKGYILNIFGKGSLKKELSLKIKTEKLNLSVFLKGWSKDLSKEYKKSEIFVLPSLYEGLGNVLLEAINYDVMCVATNCKSGPPEILMNGKCGTLVPINNTNYFARKLNECDTHKFSNKKKLKIAKKYLNRFSYKTQCEKYLNLLINVLKK